MFGEETTFQIWWYEWLWENSQKCKMQQYSGCFNNVPRYIWHVNTSKCVWLLDPHSSATPITDRILKLPIDPFLYMVHLVLGSFFLEVAQVVVTPVYLKSKPNILIIKINCNIQSLSDWNILFEMTQ